MGALEKLARYVLTVIGTPRTDTLSEKKSPNLFIYSAAAVLYSASRLLYQTNNDPLLYCRTPVPLYCECLQELSQ